MHVFMFMMLEKKEISGNGFGFSTLYLVRNSFWVRFICTSQMCVNGMEWNGTTSQEREREWNGV